MKTLLIVLSYFFISLAQAQETEHRPLIETNPLVLEMTVGSLSHDAVEFATFSTAEKADYLLKFFYTAQVILRKLERQEDTEQMMKYQAHLKVVLDSLRPCMNERVKALLQLVQDNSSNDAMFNSTKNLRSIITLSLENIPQDSSLYGAFFHQLYEDSLWRNAILGLYLIPYQSEPWYQATMSALRQSYQFLLNNKLAYLN